MLQYPLFYSPLIFDYVSAKTAAIFLATMLRLSSSEAIGETDPSLPPQVRRFADLDEICIDGWIFRLHYWVTSTALFSASMMAFAKQYFGDPIECIFVSYERNSGVVVCPLSKT